MLLAELEGNDVVLGEEDRLSRHEATDHKVMLSLAVPLEIMKRTLSSFDLGDLVVDVTVEVESVLPVVGLPSGVEVGLQLDEEAVGVGGELDAHLLRLVDALLIERFLPVVGEDQQVALVALGVQEGRSHQVALRLAIQRDLEGLHDAALDDATYLTLGCQDFDGLAVVPEEQGIVIAEADERVAGLDVVIGLRGLSEDDCRLERGETDDDGFALVGVDLVEQLQILLVGGEGHGVEVVEGLLHEYSLGEADHRHFGLRGDDDQFPVAGLQQVGGISEELLRLLEFLHVGGSGEDALLRTQQQLRRTLVVGQTVLLALAPLRTLHFKS